MSCYLAKMIDSEGKVTRVTHQVCSSSCRNKKFNASMMTLVK
jgi:hypothetical protein